MLAAARPHCLRLLGPNCLGLLVPELGLNASFAHRPARPGSIAFVSQSGGFCTAVLDWAAPRRIGFSHFVSLGNQADVDFGDVLDYLASDPASRSILLYIESIDDARKFLSAARAAARNKPVVAVKSGRAPEGARAAASHTGALTGSDAVFEAALCRAGVLRVFTMEDLFDTVETLARLGPPRDDRLAIVTNGGGPGVMAVDELVAGGGRLAELSPETVAALDADLPATWSRSNPIDLIGDAGGERYGKALRAVLADPGVDAVLVLFVPTAVVSSLDAAGAVVEAISGREGSGPILLTCWLGEDSAAAPRRLFAEQGIATYDTPSSAVSAFLQTVTYRRNRRQLMQTPPSVPDTFEPRAADARRIVEEALDEGRELLTEPEAKAMLDAYGIPCVETRIAADGEAAARAASEIGLPVALKILSPDISHKSDVGGVVLDLESSAEVAVAAAAMSERVRRLRPGAALAGFTVQTMARRPQAHELILGVSSDPVFGPVMLFGEGGTAVELIADRALALPPLNLQLAAELVERTRISRLLRGYRDRPAVDLDSLYLALVKLSQLVVDLPQVVELDVNPLFADAEGVLALDARVRVVATAERGADRLAIRPYPRELEEEAQLRSGRRLLLRPIRPEDEPAHLAFFERLQPEDVYFRFFGLVRRMPHSQLARYTQIDYAREMAFVATDPSAADGSAPETLGVVRAVFDPDNVRAELAVIVRSDLKRQGLGRLLMEKLIRYCRQRGTAAIVGQVLGENRRMLAFARSLGFRTTGRDGEVVEVRLDL